MRNFSGINSLYNINIDIKQEQQRRNKKFVAGYFRNFYYLHKEEIELIKLHYKHSISVHNFLVRFRHNEKYIELSYFWAQNTNCVNKFKLYEPKYNPQIYEDLKAYLTSPLKTYAKSVSSSLSPYNAAGGGGSNVGGAVYPGAPWGAYGIAGPNSPGF